MSIFLPKRNGSSLEKVQYPTKVFISALDGTLIFDVKIEPLVALYIWGTLY